MTDFSVRTIDELRVGEIVHVQIPFWRIVHPPAGNMIAKSGSSSQSESKYCVYSIHVYRETGMRHVIHRRYSEFLKFWNELTKIYCDILKVCKFPKRRYFNNLSVTHLERRRKSLDYILRIVLNYNPTPQCFYDLLGLEPNPMVSNSVVDRFRGANQPWMTERTLQLLKVIGQGSFGKVFLVRPMLLPAFYKESKEDMRRMIDGNIPRVLYDTLGMGSPGNNSTADIKALIAQSNNNGSGSMSLAPTFSSPDPNANSNSISKGNTGNTIDTNNTSSTTNTAIESPDGSRFNSINRRKSHMVNCDMDVTTGALDLSFEKRYALKVLRKEDVLQRKQIAHTIAERDIMSIVKHPYVSSLIYAFHSREKLYMVTEFCDGGELFFHLKKFKRFTEPVVQFYVAQIALAIEYLHSKMIIFRDLKPENVLLDSRGNCKLTDFGLSKLLRSGTDRAETFCGTPEYLAPEMVLHRKQMSGYDYLVDWWSLGILTFEMLTGWPPFFEKNFERLCEKILSRQPRFPSKLPMSDAVKDIIRGLLNKNFAERTNKIEKLMKSKWMKNMPWSSLKDCDDSLEAPYVPVTADIMEERTPNVDTAFSSLFPGDTPSGSQADLNDYSHWTLRNVETPLMVPSSKYNYNDISKDDTDTIATNDDLHINTKVNTSTHSNNINNHNNNNDRKKNIIKKNMNPTDPYVRAMDRSFARLTSENLDDQSIVSSIHSPMYKRDQNTAQVVGAVETPVSSSDYAQQLYFKDNDDSEIVRNGGDGNTPSNGSVLRTSMNDDIEKDYNNNNDDSNDVTPQNQYYIQGHVQNGGTNLNGGVPTELNVSMNVNVSPLGTPYDTPNETPNFAYRKRLEREAKANATATGAGIGFTNTTGNTTINTTGNIQNNLLIKSHSFHSGSKSKTNDNINNLNLNHLNFNKIKKNQFNNNMNANNGTNTEGTISLSSSPSSATSPSPLMIVNTLRARGLLDEKGYSKAKKELNITSTSASNNSSNAEEVLHVLSEEASPYSAYSEADRSKLSSSYDVRDEVYSHFTFNGNNDYDYNMDRIEGWKRN